VKSAWAAGLLVAVGVSASGWAQGKAAQRAVKSAALAAEPNVPVQADVVFASTEKGAVDPTLQRMQEALFQKVRYATLRKLSSSTVTLASKAQALQLPNRKTAELSLDSLKQDVATVRVKLPPAEATYTLARDKSLYLQAGSHEGGDLWLVLSQPK
jgi:hypothetical protein